MPPNMPPSGMGMMGMPTPGMGGYFGGMPSGMVPM